MKPKTFSGISLLEVLLVIAILGVLGFLIVMAINPTKRLKEVRDEQRKSDISTMSQALKFYFAEDGVASDGTGRYVDAANGTDVSTSLVILQTKNHLKVIPSDPNGDVYLYYRNGSSPPTEAALRATLESPKSSGGGIWYWCWRSVTDTASETQNCLP